MIEMFTSQGKDVVVMDTLIDNHFMSFLEYAAKEDQVKFRRVDAGLDGLTEEGETDVEAEKKLQELFREATGEKELDVKLATLKSDEMPAMITVEEQSRRFTEMSREWGGGMQMPEKRTLTLNRKHPLIAYLEREDGDADMQQNGVRAGGRSGRDGASAADGGAHGGVPQAQHEDSGPGRKGVTDAENGAPCAQAV